MTAGAGPDPGALTDGGVLHRVELVPPGAHVVAARFRTTVHQFARHAAPAVARERFGRGDDTGVAAGVASAFGALGATYVKLGQVVASAPGVFGPAVSDEFRQLLDDGRPEPPERVRRVVERELGRPIGEMFDEFDPVPIGSASIAVVHRARTVDGRDVAVKVVRPGIRRRIAADLEVMRRLLPRLAARTGGDAAIVGPLLDGLDRQLSEELDLRNEAAAMAHFRELLASEDLDAIAIPEVHEATERVLVMEFLRGVPIDDFDAVARSGRDPQPIVEQIVKAWFLTAARDGLFHGDVHAGNLLYLDDDRVAVLDWGIVGRLDDDTRDHLRAIISAGLGDEAAWTVVTDRIAMVMGPTIQARTGVGAEDLPALIRAGMEPMLTAPFSEVDLTAAFLGPQADDGIGLGFSRSDADGVDAVEFNREMFLLAKQLLYFQRYGQMYLSDLSLLSDREFFASLLET